MPAIKDLSTVHALISDLFRRPSSEAEWKQYELSKDQVEFFNTYGYLGGIKLLNEQQVERLRRELEQVAEPSHPAAHL